MNESHMRTVNNAFISDLKDGALSPVIDLVKDQTNELFLAFRKNYINVYYRGHSLYKIEQQQREYKVTFDFNHARYSSRHVELLCGLKQLGMKLPNRKIITSDDTGLIYDMFVIVMKDEKQEGKTKSGNNTLTKMIARAAAPDKEFWHKSFALLKEAVDAFFDETKTEDFFKKEEYYTERAKHTNKSYNRKKKPLLEKQRQQAIVLANRFTDDGYFVYDMEYAEPSQKEPSQKEASGEKVSGEKVSGRYDMLAIRAENGTATELLLIELKSTKEACDQNSGIAAHNEDMDGYCKRFDLLAARRAEADWMMESFAKLFGINRVRVANDINVRFVFVFTDEAISRFDEFIKYLPHKLESPWRLEEL